MELRGVEEREDEIRAIVETIVFLSSREVIDGVRVRRDILRWNGFIYSILSNDNTKWTGQVS